MKTLFFLLSFLIISNSYADPNPVLCWIFKMQGCPGVEVKQGRARNMSNSGLGGIGATGAGTDRVETRTIIKVPKYRIRRILRFFGLGGTRINVSYHSVDQVDCHGVDQGRPDLSNPLLKEGELDECFDAFSRDLEERPYGINLAVVQCQHLFCQDNFLREFDNFLKENVEYEIESPERFLFCNQDSVEI